MHTALMLVFTLFSFASFLGILFAADPYSSGLLVRILFFLSLFFSLTGILSMCNILFFALTARVVVFATALRRGALLSLLSVGITTLQTFSVLNIGNAFAAFLFVVSLEMLAIARK